VRGHRHRVEARHVPPPQAIPQDLGPWPPVGDPPRWHYDRDNDPPPMPGINRKAEVPDPALWHRKADGGDARQQGARPPRLIPDHPVWQGGGVKHRAPGPLREIPELPEWHYGPDAGVQYDDDLHVMLGMFGTI
jgi:hypothetical protein